jgi:esterase/lipase superfamily enzyme
LAFVRKLAVSLLILFVQQNGPFLVAGQSTSSTIVSPALKTSDPVSFDVAEGESLKVVADGPAGFSFDVFVYDATNHDLVGRSDDESAAPYFQWTAPAAGKYLVVLRNVSSVNGKATVTVLPRGSKGAGDTREGNRAIIEIPYATDRELKGAKDRNSIQTYGSEPAEDDKLHYGVAKVSIPRAHRMGVLESYSILKLEFSEDKEKHIVLQQVTVRTSSEFEAHINERLNSSQSHDVLVFVHGFNTTFEDGLRRAAQIKYDLNFDGAAILYSWPSHGEINPIAYNKDGRNAELSIPHFREFLIQLEGIQGVKTISVVAHSMGNRVVMHGLAESAGAGKIHIRHIALLAPDIDAAEFRKLATAMRGTADQITLYASSKDVALIASERFAGYSRAGQGPPKLIVMPGAIETVDASNVDTSALGLFHSYFADNGTILADLYHLFRDDPAERRFGLREEEDAAGKYWVLVARAR